MNGWYDLYDGDISRTYFFKNVGPLQNNYWLIAANTWFQYVGAT